MKTDIFKCMAIGSAVMMLGRFTIHTRHYLFKNYLNSILLGSAFGTLYSPYFLAQKVDKYRLEQLL
jgi:hypothetical protein